MRKEIQEKKDLQKGGKKQMGLGAGREEGLTKWSMLQEAPKLDWGGGMKVLLQEKKLQNLDTQYN
jgi:hypothetical protein